MIVADVVLDDAGLLESCAIEGHAGAGPVGGDIVCAAVTVLVRTALRTLSRAEGAVVSGSAPSRGALTVRVVSFAGEESFLAGVTAFLVEGLGSVAVDYPDHCRVRIRTERRQDHGS